MSYTIIVPCYNEEDNIIPLYNRIVTALESRSEFSILYVNDGSTDRTLEKIRALHNKYPKRVKYISFLKNSGHQKALFAGLCACKTQYAITMDADLQHPPESIPDMILTQEKTGAHIITGKRKGHQKGLMKDFLSNLFYRVFSRATGIPMETGISDFSLYTRKALDVLRTLKEREPFLRSMGPKIGFKTGLIEYLLQERHLGRPAYSFSASFKMGIRALLRFSMAPAKIGLWVGIGGIIISIAEAIHYLYLRLFTERLVPGQADLMVFLGLLGSMILLQLSLLLRMGMQIMDALQNHPPFVIEESALDDDP